MSEAPRCVYCRTRPVVERWRPFCSERCRMADLGRWLTGTYRVAGPPAEPAPDDPHDAGGEDDEPDHADR